MSTEKIQKPSTPTTPEALVEALAKLGWHRAKTASDRYSLWDAPGGAWGRILVPEDADSLGYDAALERAVSQFRRLTAAPAPAPSAEGRDALVHARAFDAGDDPDPQWVYDRLVESLAVIDDLAAALTAPSVVPEAAVEAGALTLCKEQRSTEHMEQTDDAPCTRCLTWARVALTAALPLLTAAPSVTREEVADVLDAVMDEAAYDDGTIAHDAEKRLADRLLARFTITPKGDR